jgi:mersacidin/lichenicidin family type 2 lantibiotic
MGGDAALDAPTERLYRASTGAFPVLSLLGGTIAESDLREEVRPTLMSSEQAVLAWRDRDHWYSLSDAERRRVPQSPAGAVELFDEELERIIGGYRDRGGFRPLSHEPTTQPPYCSPRCCWLTYWTGAVCCN